MSSKPVYFRTWLALVLLFLLMIVFARAGFWQLQRAAQRDANAQMLIQAAKQAPIQTKQIKNNEFYTWQKAEADGKWLHTYTVLLENRNYQGHPGFWVLTPLQQTGAKAVAVLRGWLPRESVIQQTPAGMRPKAALESQLANQTGPVTIRGNLLASIPRVLELWSWSDTPDTLRFNDDSHPSQDTALPLVQNLDINRYAKATGLALAPFLLAQTNTPQAEEFSVPNNETPFVRDWPTPSTDSHTNRGYAIQWFAFFAIAAAAWIGLLFRTIKKS